MLLGYHYLHVYHWSYGINQWLASKGYIRRKEAIPYIMGANITTLGDTLLTAFLPADASKVDAGIAGSIFSGT